MNLILAFFYCSDVLFGRSSVANFTQLLLVKFHMYHSVFTGLFSNTADTVIITQLNCRVTHVPNLIREVTALGCDV